MITFSGQSLPSEIEIHKVKVEVEPYMTLSIMCFNHFKLGHSSSNCKGESKCCMCSKPKHKKNCPSGKQKCPNCKGDHISMDGNCLIYRKEYEVKRLMV